MNLPTERHLNDRIELLKTALADRYRIERELGAGGMATVYLAHDLKHDRKVALKVLKPELAAVLGAERFVVEIKTTAALQHPHILPLFDSGTAEGFLFYVMPFINGETLRDKLNRERQLGVEEAVRLAAEVADALHYAHLQGVIHRDIKPENILLANGRPMVADFGIALAVSAAAGGRMTETGLSLGTPHYMSPEQATAEKEISARSDVYSIASVLYEALAGEPPHTGGTAQAVIMKIIAEPAPPVTKFRKSVPLHIAAALEKALEKVPADRFGSAKEFADALGDVGFRTTMVSAGERVSPSKSRATRIAVGALLAALGALAVAGWMRAPESPTPLVVTFTEQLGFGSATWQIDVSPTGGLVTLAGDGQRIYGRRLATPEFVPLGFEFASSHRLSPRGDALAFSTQVFSIVIARLDGGPRRTLVPDVGPTTELLWGEDDFVYYEDQTRRGIYRIPSGGGESEQIVALDSSTRIWPLVLLPGARALLFARRVSSGTTLHAVEIASKEERELGASPGPRGLAYAPTGHLLRAQGRYLMATPFDAKSLAFTGEAQPVVELEEGAFRFGYAGGTLAYAGVRGGGSGTPAILNGSGTGRQLVGFPAFGVMRPEASRDGTRIVFTIAAESESSSGDLWVSDLASGALTRLTRTGSVAYAAWTPDGRYIYYSDNDDVFRILADGSTAPELVLDRPAAIGRISITADGTRLLFQESAGAFDVGIMVLATPGSDTLLLRESYREGHMNVSPDGRWLAYYSDETGTTQIYVRRLDDLSRKRQISLEGGTRPRWSSDGKTLFFIASNDLALMSASLEVGEEVRVTGLRRLMPLSNTEYDVLPGDSLFVVTGQVDLTGPVRDARTLTIVHGFDAILRRLGGGGK